MIDPTAITKYNRSVHELEELLLNAITFAGKNARQQAEKMERLFGGEDSGPFASIRKWQKEGRLIEKLQEVKIGKYRLLEKSFSQLAHSGIDLTNCTVDELEVFPGIGAKTARLFVLHSRRGQKLAVIDTHVLKEMRALGMTTLKSTPARRTYLMLERKFIDHLHGLGITDFAEFDLAIWKKHALKGVGRTTLSSEIA